jgi:enoyl-CoA hydratase/carnithine racemase
MEPVHGGGLAVQDLNLLKIESRETELRILSLDRPPVNALGYELAEQLLRALDILAEDAAARCLIIRSTGKHFCAGADLKERKDMTLEEVRRFVPRLMQICNRVADLPFPSLAAVRGAAAGGGCEIALACDVRILSDDARIGLRETALAIIPGAGGMQRLSRLIGPAGAKRWVLSAAMHAASEALAEGVADRVVPGELLDEEAIKLANSIAANGPLAVRMAKKAIDLGAELPLEQALQLDWECYLETLDSDDRVEALKAFEEKRSPRYTGQ